MEEKYKKQSWPWLLTNGFYSPFNMCSKWEVHLNNLKSKVFKNPHFASDPSCEPMNAFCVGVEMAHSSLHLLTHSSC